MIRINYSPGLLFKRCGDGVAKARRAMTGSILIEIRVNRRFRRFLNKVRAGEIGKPLTQIDRLILGCQPAHFGKDRCSKYPDLLCSETVHVHPDR